MVSLMIPFELFKKAVLKSVNDKYNSANNLLSHSIMPLIESEGSANTSKVYATIFLLEKDNKKYILTAAHVLDQMIQNNSGISLHGKVNKYEDFIFNYTIPENGNREDDKLDLAFAEYKNQYNFENNYVFYDIKNEPIKNNVYNFSLYTILGYPSIINKNVFYKGRTNCISYTNILPDDSVYNSYNKYSKKRHLLINRADYFQYKTSLKNTLSGISGGAVFSHNYYLKSGKIDLYECESFFEGLIIELTPDSKYIVSIKREELFKYLK